MNQTQIKSSNLNGTNLINIFGARHNQGFCRRGVCFTLTFNRRLSSVLEKGFTSVDGSKFQANNSKDNNFTANKLDDRIAWLNAHSEEYLRQLGEIDAIEEEEDDARLEGTLTREELEQRLEKAKERLTRYEALRGHMEKNGLSQVSLTDADARLMKGKDGFIVAYNVQTAVDSATHLIDGFTMTNAPTDHGQLVKAMEGIAKDSRDEVVACTADKGYISQADMLACLEGGIAPHVITPDGKDTHELECVFEEANCDEATIASSDPKDLAKCLHAGVVPDAYEDIIESIEVKEKKQWVKDGPGQDQEDVRQGEDGMKERAGEGYFVRDPERNVVYCPAGKALRQKCVKRNCNIRYANRQACKGCKHRGRCCKNAQWKEVDFGKDTLEKANRAWPIRADGVPGPRKGHRKGHYEKVKVVRIVLRPNKRMTDQRKCLSEHPFGTIKRTMGAGHFLLRGMRKVEGEFALMALGYNLVVARNLLGFKGMMQAVTQTPLQALTLSPLLFGPKGRRWHLWPQQWALRPTTPVYLRMVRCAA